MKDLDIFINRKREDMIIVDNTILAFAFDLPNGVPISSFTGTEKNDQELLFLVSLLEEAYFNDDVRLLISEAFRLPLLQKSILKV